MQGTLRRKIKTGIGGTSDMVFNDVLVIKANRLAFGIRIDIEYLVFFIVTYVRLILEINKKSALESA